jgi:site-specific recombinase XerD
MPDDHDDGELQQFIEVVDGPLGSPLPQTKLEDVWDVALSGTISDNSKRAYLKGMVCFAEFVLKKANRPIPRQDAEILRTASPYLTHVKFPLVTEYREQMREDGYANRTINLRLAAIDKLFTRMMRLEIIDKNPASSELVPRMRTSSISETEGLDNGEAEHLLQTLWEDTTYIGLRDTAIFAVLIYNGLRRSEVIQIDLENIRFVSGTPTITLIIKRGKHLNIEFIPLVWKTIDRWMVAANITKGPIFRKVTKFRDGRQEITENRLTVDHIYAIIKSRVKQAGINKDIHPHSLRHTYATLALLAGVPIQEVQKSMGHSSTDTTFRYDRAIEQVGRSPGRSIALEWPGGHNPKERSR